MKFVRSFWTLFALSLATIGLSTGCVVDADTPDDVDADIDADVDVPDADVEVDKPDSDVNVDVD